MLSAVTSIILLTYLQQLKAKLLFCFSVRPYVRRDRMFVYLDILKSIYTENCLPLRICNFYMRELSFFTEDSYDNETQYLYVIVYYNIWHATMTSSSFYVGFILIHGWS